MLYDVVSAEYKGDYSILLTFENGKSGIVDFEQFIKKGGVFEKLRDLTFFQQFSINKELGILYWNSNVDVAPEVLYSQATGEPLPDWMSLTA
ncbi:MAG: DUF2442 domain-containing protein [Chitinivibrionales bacterium]|nr:DUF2442 domain-containing protein [Chitinivibrionales bacterium]